ncbi:12659_t:CDS:2, partial [Racocetra persica]
PKKRDPDSQAVFEKNNYYVVSEKVVPKTYQSIKRVKNEAEIVPNNKNAIVKTLTNDYTTENISFMVNVVFPYSNSRFLYFKNSIQPNKSLLFIVEELEIIQDDIYVYAKNINYIEIIIFEIHNKDSEPLKNVVNSDSLDEIAKNLLGVSDLKFAEANNSESKLKDDSKKTSMYFEEIDEIGSDQE